MLLSELHDRLGALSAQRGAETATVMVLRADPSIGPRAMTVITGAHLGFDWERGKLLLRPEQPLYRQDSRTDIDHYRAELDKAAWTIHGLRGELRKHGLPDPTA